MLSTKLDKAVADGNYAQVFIFSEELIEINSQQAKYYYLRGLSHYHLNQKDEAVKDFVACLHLDEEQFPEAKHYLEVCKFDMEAFEKGLKENLSKDYI